jgi:hypothetical protein
MGRGLRSGALVLAVAVGACTSEGGEGRAPSSAAVEIDEPTTTTTAAYPRWSVDEGDGTLTIDAGDHLVEVATGDGLAMSITDPSGAPIVADAPTGGLFVVRGDEEHHVEEVTDTVLGVDHVTFDVSFGPGGSGRVDLAAEGAHGLVARVTPDDPAVTAWGTRLVLHPDETVHRLTERIVDDGNAPDDEQPAEVGSLDRLDEGTTVDVPPGPSGDVPFHVSSAGYGLLVDGLQPGSYAVGSEDPGVLVLRFDLDPEVGAGQYHLILGDRYDEVLARYAELVTGVGSSGDR